MAVELRNRHLERHPRIVCIAGRCLHEQRCAQMNPRSSGLRVKPGNSGVPDAPGFEEMAGSNPCPRSSNQRRKFDEIEWSRTAWIRACIECVRSDAVSHAWEQGRDEHGVPLDADARASRRAELEHWLRNLVGKFRIEGKRWDVKRPDMRVAGTAECFAIGSGPGVSCLISAEWKPNGKAGRGTKYGKVQDAAIRPQILLFGVDPVAMQIRVTHVDSIAVELQGFLLDGTVILNDRWPPEVFYFPSGPARGRADLTAILNGTAPILQHTPYLAPLSRFPLDSNGNFPRRLSRVAVTQGGDVSITFYAFEWGYAEHLNQPVDFDLQLHRESQVNANQSETVTGTVLASDFTCAKPSRSGEERTLDKLETAVGVRKESATREMQVWLERLVGQYTVEGYVDLCGQGNPRDQRPITGKVDCIAAGSPPSVHCNVDVGWPPEPGENGAPVPPREL